MSAPARGHGWGRAAPAALVLVVLAFTGFALLMWLQPGPDGLTRTLSYGVRTLTGLAACAAMWHRGLRGAAELRRPRLLLAGALVCGSLSGFYAVAHQLITGGAPPLPSLADALYFSLLPLCVAGLLSYPAHDLAQGSRVRSLLNGVLAAAALWFATYALLLDPAGVADGHGAVEALTVLGYPVSDVLLIAIALSVLSRAREDARRELTLAAVGLSLLAVSDIAFSVLQAGGSYRPDSWVAVVAELGLLLILAAGLLPAAPAAAPPRAARPRGSELDLPVVLVLLVGCAQLLGLVALSAASLAGLLVLVAGLAVRHLVTSRDNTRLLRRLTEREELFRSLVTGSSDLVSLHGPDGRVRYLSPAAARVLGLSEKEMLGHLLTDVAHPDDLPEVLSAFARVLRTPGGSVTYLLRMRTAEGEWRWMETVAQNLLDHPSVRGVVCNTRDVHERVLLERRLSHEALHDALTGLPNRLALTRRVEETIATGRRSALLWLDLDGFKDVNDSLGHELGDDVLRAVADRLREVVRAPDVVGRLGGDEFVISCEDISVDDAVALAERVSAALLRPLSCAWGRHVVTASIGIAMMPAADAGSLFAAADSAMYAAKRKGASGIAVFDESLRDVVQDRLGLTNDLRTAASDEQLRLLYQPLVSVHSEEVVGVEALVRWQHPTRGLLAPNAFIDIAEETGQIVEVGEWVLRKACEQLARWQQAPPGGRPLRVAVNLSARQIADPALPAVLRRILERTDADPSLLTLEITESAVMEDVEKATRTLQDLRRTGVRIALDDFGTGHSSLTYLKEFPAQELKLDKSFIDGIGRDADGAAIVAAVINLARAVELQVVAEGVETVEQRVALDALGCDAAQGHLWHRPAPAADIERWVAARLLRPPVAPAPRAPQPGELTVRATPEGPWGSST